MRVLLAVRHVADSRQQRQGDSEEPALPQHGGEAEHPSGDAHRAGVDALSVPVRLRRAAARVQHGVERGGEEVSAKEGTHADSCS